MTRRLLLFLILISAACTGHRRNTPGFSTQQLMTAQDLLNGTESNISFTNGTDQTVNSSGVFISSYDVNDCSACFGGLVGGDNALGGFASPVTFGAGQTLQLGQNFLYNLIYNGIAVVKGTVGSSPCQLPGCSWSGDDPNVKGWCLTINVMSRHSPYTHSSYKNGSHPAAEAIPIGQPGSSVPLGYNYDLVNPATLGVGNRCLGLVTCDDKTLTCKVSTPQNQKFQSY